VVNPDKSNGANNPPNGTFRALNGNVDSVRATARVQKPVHEPETARRELQHASVALGLTDAEAVAPGFFWPRQRNF
jgi:hypothetical protein